MASDLAFHLASRGWCVSAITSRQRYDDPKAQLPSTTANGVNIRRVWSTRFGRSSLPGRAIDYLTFYASAFIELLRHRDAVVVAMTDPPLISVPAALAVPRTVNWVQDLFPEVAEGLGLKAPGILRGLRDWSLRRARRNVVLGELMAARVPNSIVIHNWADVALAPQPAIPHEHFVVGYSGNLGRAHEFETILEAMRRLPDVHFRFNGGGAQLAAVRAVAPSNATFHPYVPREELATSLSKADVHLVSLQPQLEGLIVPSKFYGILAVARPVIFVGAAEGEVGRIIREHDCGIVVAPGDAASLIAAIDRLANDRPAADAMGARGRELYERFFAPARAFAAWENVLEEAAS